MRTEQLLHMLMEREELARQTADRQRVDSLERDYYRGYADAMAYVRHRVSD